MILSKDEYLAGIRDMTYTNYDGWGRALMITEEGQLKTLPNLYLAPSNFGKDIPDGCNYIIWVDA